MLQLQEAQLLRILGGLFGEQAVIPHMRISALCDGDLPELGFPVDLERWTKSNRCLFTVLAPDETPKLVVEIFDKEEDVIDLREVEHTGYLPSLLKHFGILYVVITSYELDEVLDPASSLNIVSLLSQKIEESGGAPMVTGTLALK